MTTPLHLVADIGGTNTRVALARGGAVDHDTIRRFRNAGFGALEDVLRSYLDEVAQQPQAVCVAAAGPVHAGVARMTNLSWVIEAGNVAEATGAGRVRLLNDLQAQGHGVAHLAPGAVKTITPGDAGAPDDARLVIGVGTGFNISPVYPTVAGMLTPPSETGHTGFAPLTEDEAKVARHVIDLHGFCSIEDILSGRGLEQVYTALHPRHATPSASDIMAACGAGDDPVARASVQLFVQVLGRVSGDLALGHLPFGGVFMIGGVARAMVPWMAAMGFTGAFRSKGRFTDFMGQFAVSCIEDDYNALTGCASHLMESA